MKKQLIPVVSIIIISLIFTMILCAADTERTRSYLVTSFTQVGAETPYITAQELRDFLKSTFIIKDDDTLYFSDDSYLDSTSVYYIKRNMTQSDLRGDVDSSGTIDASDVIAIRDFITGSDTLTANEYRRADLNMDGVVSNLDLIFTSDLTGETPPVSDQKFYEAWNYVVTNGLYKLILDELSLGSSSNSLDSSDLAELILWAGNISNSGNTADISNLTVSDSVGIGTLSPEFRLDIAGNIEASSFYYKGQMATAQEILTGGQAVASGQISGGEGATNYNLFAGGNPIVHIEPDSSVGIGYGTSNHSERFAVNGDMSLLSGTNINEFSTDTTLAGNSDNAVPTEKAIKTYVDGGVDAETKYLNEAGTSLNFSFPGGLEAGYHIYSIVIVNLDGNDNQDIKVEMGDATVIWSGTLGFQETKRLLFPDFTNRATFSTTSDQNIVVNDNAGGWYDGIDITITVKKIWDN